MDITILDAPDSPAFRALLVEYAKHLLEAEALAGPSFAAGTSGASRQKPESRPPAGNAAGVRLCKALEDDERMHLLSIEDRVRRVYMASDGEERERDRMNAKYSRKLLTDKRGVRRGHQRLAEEITREDRPDGAV